MTHSPRTNARQTLDLVDEFAESTWSDIRGNGSEAEASAAEAAKPKPDWLALVRLAQAASAEADTALAGARSEVEAMDRLRAQAQHVQQLAAAEVKRAERFYETHRSDVGWSLSSLLRELQQQLQVARDALRQPGG